MAVTKFATRESLAGAFLLSCALLAASPVQAQEPNLWDKMVNTVGLGGNKAAPQQAVQAPAQAPQASQTAPQASQTAPQASQTAPQASQTAPQASQTKPQASQTAPQPVQAAQPAQSPGLFDNVLGKVGFGAKTDPSSIDYSERQKLAVPQTRDLPPPRPQPERQVTRSAGDEALTKPPGEYLQKVPGQDGQVSGLREGDTSKEKKFFGLF
jgi:hypothetical protein